MRDYPSNPMPPGTSSEDVERILASYRTLVRDITNALQPMYEWAGRASAALVEVAHLLPPTREDARHDPVDFRARTQAPPADPRLRGSAFASRGAGIAAHGRARPGRPL